MNDNFTTLLANFNQRIVSYLPTILAGLLLLAIGWLLGWFLKRVTIRVCLFLRVYRMFQRFKWASELSKADVRMGVYGFLGNIVFGVVVLLFASSALSVLNLTTISNLLDQGIYFLPRFLIAILIYTMGWLITYWVSNGILRALLKEEIPRVSLITRFVKLVLLLFFSAMALAELDIAREIVIIGFATIIITLGALTVVLVSRAGKTLLDRLL